MTPRRLADDERWPSGERDILRCACGAPCHYIEVDGSLTCLDHTTALVRISCELPSPLVERLRRQAEALDIGRNFLIETAVLGLVNDFEKIDREEASAADGKVQA